MLNSIKQQLVLVLKDMPWMLIALLMGLPLLVVVSFIGAGFNENWQHITQTVLPDYVVNSLWLMVGVTLGTLSMGVVTAWLTSMCEFPGRKLLTWALLLPLALPAYIVAYTYTGLFDFAGPVQSSLRAFTGWSYGEYWFPEVRSLAGAAFLLSLVLYPYVYMMARAAFIEQSICVLEVSRTLGNSIFKSFFKVAIPLARPAIITGLSLALMETLADYGTVQYFGVNTFTTGIFRTWYGLGDSATAAQLASVLLLFIFSLLLLEKWSRRRAKFHHTSNKYSKIKRIHLQGRKALLALVASALPVILGFVLPATQLTWWTFTEAENPFDSQFTGLVANSLLLALVAAVIAIVLALLLAYAQRLRPTRLVHASVRVASLGYAIPGTIIAVGVLLPFAWLDNSVDAYMRSHFNIATGLILSGSIVALLFAYTVRFLSVSIQAIEAGLLKIKMSMDESARSLGLSRFKVLHQIHLPMMRGTILTALLLVFVDVLKELPATLILRPFDFNTLAVRAYEMAADERLADAAPPALAIVLVGILPVLLLNRSISQSRVGSGNYDVKG